LHSWNGKFRRPADLWTANFNEPMQNNLLWVYEGLTDYYGNVLTARSGMRTPEQTRDVLAQIAANFEISPGRTWRLLEDTTNQSVISSHGATPQSWPSWQRSYDYYPESDLIWLDADTIIRERSNGQKSLDDFAKLFFGINNGSYTTVTYTLEDLVKALNTVQPYDWSESDQSVGPFSHVLPQRPRLLATSGPVFLRTGNSENGHFTGLQEIEPPLFAGS